jgi:hypothetical protein
MADPLVVLINFCQADATSWREYERLAQQTSHTAREMLSEHWSEDAFRLEMSHEGARRFHLIEEYWLEAFRRALEQERFTTIVRRVDDVVPHPGRGELFQNMRLCVNFGEVTLWPWEGFAPLWQPSDRPALKVIDVAIPSSTSMIVEQLPTEDRPRPGPRPGEANLLERQRAALIPLLEEARREGESRSACVRRLVDEKKITLPGNGDFENLLNALVRVWRGREN